MIFSNKNVMRHTPIVTTLLLEGANVGQLIRMWTEHTAAGQSLWAWFSVGVALALWLCWYRLFVPEQKIAIYSCLSGILMNQAVIWTVIYFRYLV